MSMPAEIPQQVADLDRRVTDLSTQVRYLKGKLDSLSSKQRPPQPSDAPAHREVIALTKSLFHGEVQLAEKEDPEIPGERYVMIYARTILSDEEIARKEDEWHVLMRALPGGKHAYYSLFVDAR